MRTVQPVLLDLDRDAEQAAASLGAAPTVIFRRIVLPQILPAVASGAALAFARALGEYGSLVLHLQQPAVQDRDRLGPDLRKLQDADTPDVATQQAAAIATVLLLASARRARAARPAPAPGGPPWLTSRSRPTPASAPPPRSPQPAAGRHRRAAGCASSPCSTSACSCSLPVVVLFYRTFKPGLTRFFDALSEPDGRARLPGDRRGRRRVGASSTSCSAWRRRSCSCATASRAGGCSARSSTCRSRCRRSWSGWRWCSSTARTAGSARSLDDTPLQIIDAKPGMVLATVFVSLPLVVRAVVPVLEQAGTRAGPGRGVARRQRVQRFVRITLPTIRVALAYGVVLAIARCLGEYGAVLVVSGNVEGETETATAAHRHPRRRRAEPRLRLRDRVRADARRARRDHRVRVHPPPARRH